MRAGSKELQKQSRTRLCTHSNVPAKHQEMHVTYLISHTHHTTDSLHLH